MWFFNQWNLCLTNLEMLLYEIWQRQKYKAGLLGYDTM
jgi:hypothetical protein